MKIKLIAVLTALLAFSYSNKSYAQYKPSSVIIAGHSKVGDRDSIALQILQEFGSGATFQAEKTLKTYADKGGYFKFEIKNVSKPFYITTYNLGNFPPMDWRIHALESYLVEPGDSVNIDFDKDQKEVNFSGKGAAKFRWRYNVTQYWKQFMYSAATYEK